MCVAGTNGTRTLFLDMHNAARNGLYGTGYSVSVSATTLAEIFKQHGISQCDFLKIDCEGAEYEIMKEVPFEILAHISRIAMEYHLPPYFGLNFNQHKISNLIDKLEHAGFSVKVMQENKLRGILFAYRPTDDL